MTPDACRHRVSSWQSWPRNDTPPQQAPRPDATGHEYCTQASPPRHLRGDRFRAWRAAPAGGLGPGGTATGPTVGRYSVYEITLPYTSRGPVNPWTRVTVRVDFRSRNRPFSVGGFYYQRDTWKARVAPDELGPWRWTAVIRGPFGTKRLGGDFVVVDWGQAGFVRRNPRNPFRFVTSNGDAGGRRIPEAGGLVEVAAPLRPRGSGPRTRRRSRRRSGRRRRGRATMSRSCDSRASGARRPGRSPPWSCSRSPLS